MTYELCLVEVLRRNSNNYGAVQRVRRLIRHLAEHAGEAGPTAPPLRPMHRPHKLSQRLTKEAVAAIVTAYQAGSTTRELGARFGLAHSSINKVLKQQSVKFRRRGSRTR